MEPVTRAYVLNLDVAKYRTVRGQCGRHGIVTERVKGLRGSDLTEDDLDALPITDTCVELCTPAAIAIALGHMRMWERVAEGPDAHALLLEDDVELLPGFGRRLKREMREVPRDFHVLLVGLTWKVGLPAAKLLAFGGTHSYVLSRQGARYLLDRTARRANFHIDIAMSAMLPHLKTYSVQRPLTRNLSADGTDPSATSAAGSSKFPMALSHLYAVHCEVFKLPGGVHVTPVHIAAFVAGLAGVKGRGVASLVVGFVLADAVFAGRVPDVVDIGAKAAFYAAGRGLQGRL